MPVSQECENTPIEALNVSNECLQSLREVNFETVGDVVNILEQYLGKKGLIPYARYLHYLDEVIDALKQMGCWPEGLWENRDET
jgi:hypothetical protein